MSLVVSSDRGLSLETVLVVLLAFLIDGPVIAGLPVRAAEQVVPTPTHVYQLNGDLRDSLGGPSLISHGGTLEATGYSFPPNQGLTLIDGLTDQEFYSIETVFRLRALPTWVKIVDFKEQKSDDGFYSNFKKLYFYPVVQSSQEVFRENVNFHLVLTRDNETGLVIAYVNGIAAISFFDKDGLAVSETNVLNFFVEDLRSTAEGSAGFVDLICIYDRSLKAEEATALRKEPCSKVPKVEGAKEPVREPSKEVTITVTSTDIRTFTVTSTVVSPQTITVERTYAGELSGRWKLQQQSGKEDGQIVEFRREGQAWAGYLVDLGTLLPQFGFSIGEQTFRNLRQTKQGVYEGEVKFRSTLADFSWRAVSLTVSGDTMTWSAYPLEPWKRVLVETITRSITLPQATVIRTITTATTERIGEDIAIARPEVALVFAIALVVGSSVFALKVRKR